MADEEALPFGPARFDLVASVMALHWTNDLPGALIQARHILKPDGLFMAAMIGGESLAELRRCLIEAEAAITGGASPRVSPFVDGVDAGQLLQRAGFAMPVSDTDRLTVRYRSILDLMHDLRGMGEAAAFSSPSRPLRRDVLLRAGEIYAARHGDVDGRLPARFDIVWLSGWAPAPGQPVPKRPGSATASLAQAVGATERPAGDPANPRTPDAAGD